MNIESERHTYRGGSLEELLPRIKEELGEDAVVVRQREGVIGGFGGFFGKHCVEVEVVGPPTPERFSIPGQDAASRYQLQDEPTEDDIVQTLIGQAAPFGSQLGMAAQRLSEEEEGYEPPEWTGSAPAQPELEPAPVREARQRRETNEADAICSALIEVGLAEELAASLVSIAAEHVVPLERCGLAEAVRLLLARRVPVVAGWSAPRRTIAIVGPARAGRTLMISKIAGAYARAGASVGMLSLEPAKSARTLFEQAECFDLPLWFAESASQIGPARARAKDRELLLVDTPPLFEHDRGGLQQVANLLRAVRPHEIHLLVPAPMGFTSARHMLNDVLRELRINRLVLNRLDQAAPAGAVALAIGEHLPISWVASGGSLGSELALADPSLLTEALLP